MKLTKGGKKSKPEIANKWKDLNLTMYQIGSITVWKHASQIFKFYKLFDTLPFKR